MTTRIVLSDNYTPQVPNIQKITENKNCMFTTIIHDYDVLLPQNFGKSNGWDYVCFTDDVNLKSDFWKIIYIKNESKTDMEHIKLSKHYKTNFFNHLKQYNNLFWLDAHILINIDLNDYLKNLANNDIIFVDHPWRENISQEIDECVRLKKETPEMGEAIKKKYDELGYKYDNGLIAGGFILFNNNEKVIRFFSQWWDEIKNFSHRDQLSANFVLWKNPDIKHKILRGVYNNHFKVLSHKKKEAPSIKIRNDLNPKITIFTSSYNHSKFLNQSIESVLGQTYGNFEYLLFDDGSNDSTYEIMKQYEYDNRVKVFKLEKQANVGVVINKSIELSNGDYWSWCPADDYWHPTLIEKKIKYIKRYPDSVLYNNFYVIDGTSKINGHYDQQEMTSEEFDIWVWKCKGIGFTGIFIPMRVFKELKVLFPEHLPFSEDFYWMIKATIHGVPFNLVPERLNYKRRHNNSLTTRNSKRIFENVPKIREELLKYKIDNQIT